MDVITSSQSNNIKTLKNHKNESEKTFVSIYPGYIYNTFTDHDL